MLNTMLVELVLGILALAVVTAAVFWTVETFKIAVEAIREEQR